MGKNKSVLVLGVGPEQGLGVALCKKFAEEGYDVLGCGRNSENMSSLNLELIGGVLPQAN